MKRIISTLLVYMVFLGQIGPQCVQSAVAQTIPSILQMPSSGAVLSTSAVVQPVLIKGLKVNLDNPFQFDFIVDSGDSGLEEESLQAEAQKLIRYFLTALTVPEDDIWVNLSPVESDRIVPESLGQTRMGRDMLALDYLLKQMTASLMYPDAETGGSFWKQIHQKAQQILGTTSIPVDTFHKVWIIPEKAVVYEEGAVGYVVDTHLKVMLEDDYLALQKLHKDSSELGDKTKEIGSQSVRDIVLPILEKEINEGEHFAPLRQVYHALILSEWYKTKFQQSLLAQVYVNQSKVAGDQHGQGMIVKDIYKKYLDNIREGSYSMIKEELNPITEEVQLRKYFSGGFAYPKGSSSITTDRGAFEKVIKQRLKKLFLVSSFLALSVLGYSPLVVAQTSPDAGIQVQANRQVTMDRLYTEYPSLKDESRLFDFEEKDFKNDPLFSMDEYVNLRTVRSMFGYLLLVDNADLNQEFIEVINKDPELFQLIKSAVYKMPNNTLAIQIVQAMVKNNPFEIWTDFRWHENSLNALRMLVDNPTADTLNVVKVLQSQAIDVVSKEAQDNELVMNFVLLASPVMWERGLSLNDVMTMAADPFAKLVFMQSLYELESYPFVDQLNDSIRYLVKSLVIADMFSLRTIESEETLLTQRLDARLLFWGLWEPSDFMNPKQFKYFWKVLEGKLTTQNLSLLELSTEYLSLFGKNKIHSDPFSRWLRMMSLLDLENTDQYQRSLLELSQYPFNNLDPSEVYVLPQIDVQEGLNAKRFFLGNDYQYLNILQDQENVVLAVKRFLQTYFKDDSFFENHPLRLTAGLIQLFLNLGIDEAIRILDQAQLIMGSERFTLSLSLTSNDALILALDEAYAELNKPPLPGLIHDSAKLKADLKGVLPKLDDADPSLDSLIDSWSREQIYLPELIGIYRDNIGPALFQLWYGTSEQQRTLVVGINSDIVYQRGEHLKALKSLLGEDVISEFLIPNNVSVVLFDSFLRSLSDEDLQRFVLSLQNIFSQDKWMNHFKQSYNNSRWTTAGARLVNYQYLELPHSMGAFELLSDYERYAKKYPEIMKVLYEQPAEQVLKWFYHVFNIGMDKADIFIEYLIAIYGESQAGQGLSAINIMGQNPDLFKFYNNFEVQMLPSFDSEYQSGIRFLKQYGSLSQTLLWVKFANQKSIVEVQVAMDAARVFLGRSTFDVHVMNLSRYFLKYGYSEIQLIQDEMKRVLGEGNARNLITVDLPLYFQVLENFDRSYDNHKNNMGNTNPVLLQSFSYFVNQVIRWGNEWSGNGLAELYDLNSGFAQFQNLMVSPRDLFLNVLDRIATQGGNDMLTSLSIDFPYLFDYENLSRDAIPIIKAGLRKLPPPRTFLASGSLEGDPEQKTRSYVGYALHALAVVRILDPEVITQDYYEKLRFLTMAKATIQHYGRDSENANTNLHFGSDFLKKVDYSVAALMEVLMHEYGHHLLYPSFRNESSSVWVDFNKTAGLGESGADSVALAGFELLGWDKFYDVETNFFSIISTADKISDISARNFHGQQRYQRKLLVRALRERGLDLDFIKFYKVLKEQTQDFFPGKLAETSQKEMLVNYLGKTSLEKEHLLKKEEIYPRGIISQKDILKIIDYKIKSLAYKVQAGDTIGLIVQKFNAKYRSNVTAVDIAKHNDISNPNLIREGQILQIPFVSWGVAVVDGSRNDQASAPVGGIDLSRKNWELVIENVNGLNCQEDDQTGCMNIPFSPDQIKTMQSNIPGLVPVIFNIQPIVDLPLILGLQDQESPQERAYKALILPLAAK